MDEVQTLPLNSAADFCGNHVSEDKQSQQTCGGGRIKCRIRQAGSTRIVVGCGLLVLLFLLVIIALLVALTTRRCIDTRGQTDTSNASSAFNLGPQLGVQFFDGDGKPCAHQAIRLPRRISPVRYLLVMTPVLQTPADPADFKSHNFGRVDMDLNCAESTEDIIFHVGDEQKITRLEVTSLSSTDPVRVKSSSQCLKLTQLHVRISRPCVPGERLNLSLSFTCPIDSEGFDGFYQGSYKDARKIRQFLASTHLEPISARKAFPCFDEPDMKATFKLEMIHDSNHQVLFNMPLQSKVLDNGCVSLSNKSAAASSLKCFRDVFQESVLMSTYLVAYALLPMDYVSLQKEVKTQKGSVKVGIWAPSHSRNHLQFAMNVTEKVLPYFEELFNLSYPLPKLDMIGVPDFSAGAMENWGLIIYRFSTLLYDPTNTPTLDKQSVAEVISHEIAHQWFGNIVTMKWWDDLWLNEAFAVFTQFMGVEAYDHSWNMMDRCYVEFVATALQTDSMLHTHPIIVAGVSDPNEIESLFDDISYFKGSSLIRMLEGVIGRKVLKEGIVVYLNRFAWRNAASQDLFTAFSEAYMRINGNSGPHANSPVQNLTRVMDTWTTQVNYPLVTVKIRGKRLHFKQERFLLYPEAATMFKEQNYMYSSPYNFKWIIPIMYITDKYKEPQWTWMDLEETTTVELDHEPKFIKINYLQSGLYRCSYEYENWQQLIQLSRQGFFNSTDVAGLLNDAFTLASIGRLNISVPFDLFETLKEDWLDSGTPWNIAMRKISEISMLIASDNETEMHLAKLIKNVLQKPLKNILSKSEDSLTHTDKIKRQNLNQIALMVDEASVVDLCRRKYKDWRDNQSIVLLPDEIDLVYQIGVTKGGADDWEFFWDKAVNGAGIDTRHMLSALTMSNDLNLINRLIQIMFDSTHIPKAEAVSLAAKLVRRPGVQDLIWTHIERNWDLVVQRYGTMAFLLTDITKFPADYHTIYDYNRIQSFFKSNTLLSGKRNAYQSLEQVLANMAWIKFNLENFKAFIRTKAATIV